MEQHRQNMAGDQAGALIARLGMAAPIDPLRVAESEREFIRFGGRDFGTRFDGKLKYIGEKNLFLLLFNTKYDTSMPEGRRHPRTRFSIAHELGHYFIPHHHKYLRRAGRPHPSNSEFRTDVEMEREADAFAASLLLPTHLAKPIINKSELTLARLDGIAEDFQTSLVCTAIRAAKLSDDPCAVAGIRNGQIAWMFPSERLIEAGCYPGKRKLESPYAQEQWRAFTAGNEERVSEDGRTRHWFQMFGRDEELHEVYVTEQFLPVQIMDMLVVLLTLDDDDLFSNEDGEEEEDD